MSLSKATNAQNCKNWEDSDIPILCQTCLGDNPYVRMIKERYGKECKVCSRPFTVFRWCPGLRMRFKKTEICPTCARLKNVCQTCVLDLDHGLPVQVLDSILKGDNNNVPQRETRSQNVRDVFQGSAASHALAPTETLTKLSRMAPYYKRNRPRICSFWARGECKRGQECPYRHEKPHDPDDPLCEQNIKDRYYGRKDPVAEKLLQRVGYLPKLEAPEDQNVCTLYVGNLTEKITEPELRNVFYQYGDIRSVTLVPRQSCAFVQYTKRSAAELAADRTFNKLMLKGRKISISWAHSQPKNASRTDRRLAMPGGPNGYNQLDQEEINIMPAGLKLDELPPTLVPAKVYQQYAPR